MLRVCLTCLFFSYLRHRQYAVFCPHPLPRESGKIRIKCAGNDMETKSLVETGNDTCEFLSNFQASASATTDATSSRVVLGLQSLLSPRQTLFLLCLLVRGLCLVKMGKPEAALSDFTKACELESTAAVYHYQKASLLHNHLLRYVSVT